MDPHGQARGILRRINNKLVYGTAALVRDDPSIFTFSIHGANNFPLHKDAGDLDIELDDGTGDEVYLESLENGLKKSLQNFRADLAIYLSGADPYKDDRFGRLALSITGLARRDHLVLNYLHLAGLPWSPEIVRRARYSTGATIAAF